MKRIIKLLKIVIVIIPLLPSCAPIKYTLGKSCPLSTKLPPLRIQMDIESFDIVYPNRSYTTTSSNTTYKPGYYTDYGGYSVITKNPSANTQTSTSTYFNTDPRRKSTKEFFENWTYKNLCEQGHSMGTIVWSIECDDVDDLNPRKACWCPLFWPAPLFGFPLIRYTAYFGATATIYDANGDFIAKYSARYRDGQWCALYWGYKSSDAYSIAKTNAKCLVMNDIQCQIEKDLKTIQSRLYE